MNVESQLDKKYKLKNTITLSVLFSLIILCLTGGTVTYLYKVEIKSYYSNLKVRGLDSIDRQRSVISQYFNTVLPDLLFFSRQNELISMLNSGNSQWADMVVQEYAEFAKKTKLFAQIRYIGKDGREKIRVDYNEGKISITPEENLQDKSKRDYFTRSISLNRDEIFVSELDLNMEHGEIQLPYNPVIRLSTPVFDNSGEKRGIIVFNCRAKKLLDDISYYADPELGRTMLCNSDGYWLLSPDFDDKWGFILDERKDRNFKIRYSEEWDIISSRSSFEFETINGFFSFSKIFPLLETSNTPGNKTESYLHYIRKPDPSQYYWILITQIPSESILITKKKIFRKYIFSLVISLIILLPGAYILASGITRSREYKAKLLSMALYDPLTELPNRRYFRERLRESIEQARRFGRKMGLLYIDLDGFKEVNDTKGHDAGDELLIKIAEILRQSTRTADIPARLGGDEFAIILFEVDSREGAFNAGKNCLKNIDTRFQLNAGTVKISASIGVAVFPDHGSTPDEIIKEADTAMYYSKTHGKNVCTLAAVKQ